MKKSIVLLTLFSAIFLMILQVSCKDEEEDWDAPVETGSVQFTVRGCSFNMQIVQGGTFTMGATSEQGTHDPGSNEYPTHQVTLSDYLIGETEVTQELWISVMDGDDPATNIGLNKPVGTVSWNDCNTFITRLNQLTGEHFRMPTEAEWEYAARGGRLNSGYKYSGSDNVDEVAWYCENTDNTSQPVKQKQPNQLGIYDMSGNVHEWCSDIYELYPETAQTNPRGAENGPEHIIRGGAYLNTTNYCRVSYRFYYCPSQKSSYVGLRLAMSK